ncbi:TRAP transporter small permease [Fredinandcohnia onubensis]|uniref:TRAP transporter small permease n=1 Tax=Fredinandcohnia onubensis TaxID=1571209 RepID=UPI0015D4D451|nr:TRAP transporter small permease [Fredinandcohnia onubensis]
MIITKVIDRSTSIIKWISMICLLFMVLATFVGVVFRMFGVPIIGNDEIVAIFQVFLIMFSLAFAQSEDRHITIGIIVDNFPTKVQVIIDRIGYTVTALFCFLVAYIFFKAGYHNLTEFHEKTLLLEFPHYFLKFITCLGFFLWGMEAVNRIIKSFLGLVKQVSQLEKEVSG